ncbi:MAG: hypothetical protein AB8G11_23535 [Saprospiraceae bacterium]
MKNYFKYVCYLVIVLSFFACQETPDNGEQTTENQQVTEEKTVEHQPQPAPKTLTDEADNGDEAIDRIEQIRADYAATMEKLDNGTLKKISKEFECEEDHGGGTLTRYFNGDEIELLEYSIGGEHAWNIQKIYFKNAKPYFVFVEEGAWYFGGEDGTDDSGENTVDDIEEIRYYLEDGKVIRKLSKKYLIKSWEEKPKINEIPNKTVTDGVGKPYPKAEAIPNLLKGKAGC